MVRGFKPGKYVKKLYSYHKVSTNPWFQTMILYEVIVSNKLFQSNYTFQQYLFQTMKAKYKSWFPNHEHCLPNHDHGLTIMVCAELYAQCTVFLFLEQAT
jgi:hypothetical protein